VIDLLSLALILLLIGSLIYCALAVIAALHYLAAKHPKPPKHALAISILKPLAGAEEGLEENLRSFFEQDHPEFELLFAVHTAHDPAARVVETLCAEYPRVPATLIVSGEAECPNPKVGSLQRMLSRARHELLIISDSDVHVGPDMLRGVAAEFQDESVALVTCPYRAVAGASWWSKLEALGMNTEFLGGVLTARLLDGMKFALGALIGVRRDALERAGGFEALRTCLADDFALGQRVAETGGRVLLSSYVAEHRIGSQSLRASLAHRLRWNRSTRRSRPQGYLGQLFMHTLPITLLAGVARPSLWPWLAAAAVLRIGSSVAIAHWVARDSVAVSRWWLLPAQDLLSFIMWIAGFFGSTIAWRERRYRVLADGRLEPLAARAAAITLASTAVATEPAARG
jgi:ceramide glucosyltransferase